MCHDVLRAIHTCAFINPYSRPTELTAPTLPAGARVDLVTGVQVALLTLIWGTNWPLFRFATAEVSVWTFRAIAVSLAGVALLAFARARGQSLVVPRREWPIIAWASIIYLGFWNITSTYAAILIPSGQAAVLGFTMPFWAALITWAVFGERPGRRMSIAIGLGAIGVGLLMLRGAQAFALAPLGFALGLTAGLGWAIGTIILKRHPVSVSGAVLAGWQLLISVPPMLVVALWLGGGAWFMPSMFSVAVIAYIALVPMSIGNAIWFTLVGKLPANVAGLSSIMVPVVAMVSGALVHGEPLGLSEWLAMACCAGGLGLALLKPAVPR